MAAYQVENQWGGSDAPWNTNSTWILGTRDNQYLVAIDIVSNDVGKTFAGTITYNGEGPIDFRAKHKSANMYYAKVRWGGEGAPWHSEGIWIIGGRNVQRAVQLKAEANVAGNILLGTVTYEGEGPIGFRGTFITSYEVKNRLEECPLDWYNAGTWVLSGRLNQDVVAMRIRAKDECANVLVGTMTYVNEGPIGFKAVRIVGNNYEVYNQWGGTNAPWHRGGDMIIGGTSENRVSRLNFVSKDAGIHLYGEVAYLGDQTYPIKAKRIQQVTVSSIL